MSMGRLRAPLPFGRCAVVSMNRNRTCSVSRRFHASRDGGTGMADEATRAVGVPQGVPVGWVAPDSAILDRGDLETMRDGLRAGKTVAIASDGHVYVSGDATGQPMTPEAQQFIESRLGVV